MLWCNVMLVSNMTNVKSLIAMRDGATSAALSGSRRVNSSMLSGEATDSQGCSVKCEFCEHRELYGVVEGWCAMYGMPDDLSSCYHAIMLSCVVSKWSALALNCLISPVCANGKSPCAIAWRRHCFTGASSSSDSRSVDGERARN